MTVKELSNMGSEGMEGITEIKFQLDEWDEPKKSEEERSSSS